MNDWKARAAPAANTPPPPPVPPPSVPPPQSSSGRSSPANLPPPDDGAAAVARVASEFRSLERLRDAGYGGAIVREKVNEIRAAVSRLPEAVRGRVVALVEDRAEEMELLSQIVQKEADLAWRKAELAALKERARRAAAARLERGRVCDSCGRRPSEHTPLERCDGCGGPRYCGDACRKAHWLAGHRDECAAGVAFIT
jgi:hypothetical protein